MKPAVALYALALVAAGAMDMPQRPSKTAASPATPLPTPTPTPTPAAGGSMGGMPFMGGMANVSSMLQDASAFIQSIVDGVASFNSQAASQITAAESQLASGVSSVASVLQTNSIVNAVLLPFTDFSAFDAGVRSEAAKLGSRIDADVEYAEQQLESFSSSAGRAIGSAATDASRLFNSVYSFAQKGVDVMLSSPLLTAATLINPVVFAAAMAFAADPVKLLTDYPAWEAEVNSRQSVVSANFGSVYTFVSTGLPQAENAALGILSELAKFGNNVMSVRIQRLEQGRADVTARDALRSAAYYQLQTGYAPHTEAGSVQYVPVPTPAAETATAAAADSAQVGHAA
ncbi:hypothetical protein H4R18_002526 [Coemansia javaensis]|uniref:Uncharacterized protein n=1 Tax=Coemansia javaensis TaxID=2761396 RepID=A0A9W8HHC9_9FUNG|nr:hypothetical protein H4R18_002526 [Coemansia javaensis]